MNIAGMIPNILYLIAVLLLLPCTIVMAVVLCFGKNGVNKGLWITSVILSVLACGLMAIVDVLMQLAAYHYDASAIFMTLRRVVLPLLCFVPAMLFPLAATLGRKGGWKPLLLVPALIACPMMALSRMGFVSVYTILLVCPLYIPTLVMLVLAAVWYYTGKNLWVGLLMALVGAGTLFLQPFVSAVLGMHMMQAIDMNRILESVGMVFRSIGSHGLTYVVTLLRVAGFPLAAYAVIAQLTVAGVHGKRLPKEKV